jgi:hypothetical protein
MSRLAQIIVILTVNVLVALLVYVWCLAQGTCSGECIAVGYSVTKTCIFTALKVFVGLFLAMGVFALASKKPAK